MITATGMRAEARKHLTGKWNRGALIAFCYFIVESVLELIGNGLKHNNALHLAYQIIFFIISVPISYGFIISFIKLKRGEPVEAFEFLRIGFSNFSRAWSIAWHKFLKMIVPVILMVLSIILLVSTVVLYSANTIISRTSEVKTMTEKAQIKEEAQLAYFEAQNNYNSNPSTSNYNALKEAKNRLEAVKSDVNSFTKIAPKKNNNGFPSVIFILAIILYIASVFYMTVKSLSLSLSSFIAYDNDDMSGKESCELSQKLMKGNKGNLFVLSLSFIGWAILTVFTLGIGTFWLIAYTNVSVICFYETLANKDTEISIENE